MAILSNLDLIRRVSLFTMLTDEQAVVLADAVVKKRFKSGEFLVKQGEKSNALYIILAGRAHVFMSDEKGREVILNVQSAGDYVGEMSLIDNEPHSASVVVDRQVDALELKRGDFLRCISENIGVAHSIMYVLVQRLRHASDRISSLALAGVYDRVARVLKESANQNEQGEWIIRGKISRQEIAKMVGASREMVSRVIKDYEERGILHSLDNGTFQFNAHQIDEN
ncbi:MAG: hypothetical protein RIR79_1771 [Pseudomonadota bacterium]